VTTGVLIVKRERISIGSLEGVVEIQGWTIPKDMLMLIGELIIESRDRGSSLEGGCKIWRWWGDTKGVRRIERGWGIRDILTSEQSLGKIMIMADNLEGLPTVSTVIEMVIIKLPAQPHLSATIVGKMGTKLCLALQKKGFNLRLCGFGLQGQGFYYIQIPEEEGEPQLKTFPGILSMREGRASETIIDNELKHLFRGGSGWTIQ
jgi:hypothetical protein